MFKKILIANRGEIAVRVINTCREMNIATVAVYEYADRHSLHVAYADEAVLLPNGFSDGAALIEIAKRIGADAIHPGYGFLAEEASFIRACDAAGLTFIGGPADILDVVHDKVAAIETVRAAGFRTVECSDTCHHDDVRSTADALGYPLVIKSCYGGRGPGTRLVRSAKGLESAVRGAAADSLAVFGQRGIYLEKALLPANQVGVQVLADKYGALIHLGEREGSWQYNNRKLIEEAPAPCLNESQRVELWKTALAIARLFTLENAATVEFLVDADGQFYFAEVKSRIQTEHPLTEMLTRVDVVREQIRIAAGESLSFSQADVHIDGHAILCRVHAEDPLNGMRPSPGKLSGLKLPVGAEVRIDTYVHPGCDVAELYDSLIGKVTVWGKTREEAAAKMRRALTDFTVTGIPTDVTFTLNAINKPEFIEGRYSTETGYQNTRTQTERDTYTRDLAALAAVLYVRRYNNLTPVTPERLQSGWHKNSRRLPE